MSLAWAAAWQPARNSSDGLTTGDCHELSDWTSESSLASKRTDHAAPSDNSNQTTTHCTYPDTTEHAYQHYNTSFQRWVFSGRPQSNLHTHWHTQSFYGPFPGLPGCASARRNLLDFMEQGKITEADTPTIQLGSTPSGFRTNQWPTSIIPLFLCWMPFLPQHPHFILAWDGHQICWLAYPVAWLQSNSQQQKLHKPNPKHKQNGCS